MKRLVKIMGYYTRNGGLIGTGTNSQLTGVSDIVAAQLSQNKISDLREFMDDVGTAIQNGRTGYLLSTNNYSYRFDAGDARYINDGGGDIYDRGNYTSPVSSSTRSTSSPSTGNQTTNHPDAIFYNQTSS